MVNDAVKRVLIYLEKPNQKLNACALQQRYPNATLTIIHSIYFRNTLHLYPEQEHWNNYPLIIQPQHFLAKEEDWLPKKLNQKSVFSNITLYDTTIHFNTIQQDFDLLVYAGEVDGAAYRFDVFIQLLGLELMEKEYFMFIHTDENNLLEHALNSNQSENKRTFDLLSNEGRVKDYFNFNFNLNSQYIFNISNLIANRQSLLTMSKYMLQCLLFVKEKTNFPFKKITNHPFLYGLKTAELISFMHNWGEVGNLTKLGSPASIVEIKNNLIEIGLLIENDIRNVRFLELTEKGNNFLYFLSPSCKDYQLPFKIENWQKQNFNKIKQEIDSYISDFFQSQKDFINERC